LETLLAICRDKQASIKVKKVAFKALGDVSTNYFGSSLTQQPKNYEANKKVCQLMCEAILSDINLEKESASSSMALYAIGNLARILKQSPRILMDPLVVQKFSVILCKICKKKTSDPKMQTNAIRGTGHLVCLVYSDIDRKSAYQESIDISAVLVQALDTLVVPVQKTISLARKEIKDNLSWKERSSIKKLGWGACHTLSLVLSTVQTSAHELDDCCVNSIHVCLQTLINCVYNVECVHEKVALVAMSALCSVDLSSSRLAPSFNHDRQLGLGVIISQCLWWIQGGGSDADAGKMTVLSPKVKSQMQQLLLHFLSCCSVQDSENVLSGTLGRDRQLRFLYDWLLKQKKGSNSVAAQRAFDTFALAMQKRPDLLSTIDINLEQQFANQAKTMVSLHHLEDFDASGDDDNEEEL